MASVQPTSSSTVSSTPLKSSGTNTESKAQEVQTTSESPVQNTEEAYQYESGSSDNAKKVTYHVDMDKVKQMKLESERRMIELFRRTVTDGFAKQYGGLKKVFETLSNGGKVDGFDITDKDIEAAKLDIAPGGYWSAEATSDRFLDFAKALSGGDASKADVLINAFKKGYEEASRLWGGELPAICKETYDLTLKKFDEWVNESK